MPVHEPVGSFASTGLIDTLAWLALPLVLALIAFATPAFRRHAAQHRDQVRDYFYEPSTTQLETSPAAGPTDAAAEAAPAAATDDFDYDIYDDTPSSP